MQFTRNLKQGMNGEDVFYIKKKLFALGYYPKDIKSIESKIFGKDTVEAVEKYQRFHKDTSGKALVIDGIIGEKTWKAIERDSQENKKITFTRNLKKGMSGDDVRYIKERLFELGYYSTNITDIKSDTFGNDTVDAVEKFQRENGLTVDAIIGIKTWAAIEAAEKRKEPTQPAKPEVEEKTLLAKYTHIAADKRKLIEADLAKVSDLRQLICLEILDYAYDKDVPGDVRALYVFGANLYDTKGNINYADKKEITSAAAGRNSGYFTNGRKEWMLKQVERCATLPSSDCSGMEVGYLRKHKLVDGKFDRTANGLCGSGESTAINKSALKPGDWVGKSGHIGTYVGGGYVVEFYGGAYGCQLTKLNKRQGYDFIAKKVKNGSAWTKFRRPKYY